MNHATMKAPKNPSAQEREQRRQRALQALAERVRRRYLAQGHKVSVVIEKNADHPRRQ